jgi:hypothetical protein
VAPSANPIIASQPPTTGAGHAHQVLAGLLALCTTALAILLAILLGIWWRQPAYVMPFWVVLAGCLCAGLTGTGGVLATRRGQVTSWLAPTVTLAALLGFLSVVGVLVLLPVMVVLLLVANHRGHRVPAIPQAKRRVSAGLVLTLGLVPLCLLVLLRGPVVDCTSDGVDEGSPIWMWLGSLGTGAGIAGTASTSSDLNQTTGSITAGGTTYSFVCVGNKLAQFAKQ